jgi:hypothetical protein
MQTVSPALVQQLMNAQDVQMVNLSTKSRVHVICASLSVLLARDLLLRIVSYVRSQATII